MSTVCSATPGKSLSNKELSEVVDTSDEWITTRTGIRNRRITDEDSGVVDLGTEAAKQALKNGNIRAGEIDLIILASSTPDDLFGSAGEIQNRIGAQQAAAFDITAACSGFVISLLTGSQFINNGIYNTILVIGADVLSKWVNWSDRTTCILFGDAAGAVILKKNEDNFILSSSIKTDGSQNKDLFLKSEDKIINNNHNLHHRYYNFIDMNGREVYKFAVSRLPIAITECLKEANLNIENIDWLLLHQANERILTAIATKLSLPEEKIINNLCNYGNTSAASIPLALDEAVQANKLKKNDKIIMAGFGAGFTWSVVIIKWI
uniref:3-oxoacyl-acyl-carrier-protein synthase 3 n=1 Tax=Pseudoerythrocladia kornmannii TaxID=753682 RepID=UPI001FCCC3F4|nr:3-oxoacyl-acyl-carrier-protein synthase 3 [Pseudoerythrocladia kornmannii]UNJ16678.1 3-oxoacyl-acyl-carrier-protein synthase 3 [Pseudoerythrocladia kornmannii]